MKAIDRYGADNPGKDFSPDTIDMDRRSFLGRSAAFMALLTGSNSPLSFPQTTEGSLPKTVFRRALLDCLGGPWPDSSDLKSQAHNVIRKVGYRIEAVTYRAEEDDRVSALLMIPDGVDENNPAPAVAVWHQHNGQWNLGKLEPAGLAGNPMHHTGVLLVKEGYVVLCPDAHCFGDRRSRELEEGLFEQFEFLRYLVMGRCLAWKNILDMRRAIDFLCSRPEVQNERIGCYGHSMGSAFTWLVGPWEPRLKCLVGNCSLPTYSAIHRAHLLHSATYYIPGLLQCGDTPDVVSLIAPRPLHLNFGGRDQASPITEVREALQTIEFAYQEAGAPGMFTHYIEDQSGHVLSGKMWEHVREKFADHLKV